MILARTNGIACAAILRLQLAGVCLAAQKPLAEWIFEKPADRQGWQPNSHPADSNRHQNH